MLINTSNTLFGLRAYTNENIYIFSSNLLGIPNSGIIFNAANDLNSVFIPLSINASSLNFNGSSFKVNTALSSFGYTPTNTIGNANMYVKNGMVVNTNSNENLLFSTGSTGSSIYSCNDNNTVLNDLNFSATRFNFTNGNVNVGYIPGSLIGNSRLYVKNGMVLNTNSNENLLITSGSVTGVSGVSIGACNNNNTSTLPLSFQASKFSFHGASTFSIGSPVNCTFPSDAKLIVNGKIYATSIQVKLSDANGCFPDYVFEKDYQLMSLYEVEKYIEANKHLPDVPSATEVQKNGVDLFEMNIILLKKIEELTLHVIQMEKQLEILKKE